MAAAARYRAPMLVMRGRAFAWGARTYIMGIINVTPDSFSGDGVAGNPAAAVRLAREMEAAGADILDLGAESSRPNAIELPAAEECARLLPTLRAVRAVTEIPISVDTYHSAVAAAALEAGADMLNDIHGLRRDPEMARLAARRGVPVVAMHNQRGRPFRDVVTDILSGFEASARIADAAGLDASLLIMDPGFGFGWTPERNLEMIRRLPEIAAAGFPVLLGPSRKSTIGLVLDAPPGDRLEGTAALVALGIAGGADIVRVHDVRQVERVVRISDAVVRGSWHRETEEPAP